MERNSPAGRQGSRQAEAIIVCAILSLTIAIRLPALFCDGLWRDEANVYVQLVAPDFAEFLRRVVSTEWHPPLFFFIMYCWAKAAGSAEIALEVVPFCLSVATGAMVYRLGRATGSIATAATAATIYAVSPLAVEYSGEYLYPLAGFVSTLLALLVVCARKRPLTPARFLGLAFVTLLVVYTHYTSLIYIPLLAVWALTYGGRLRQRLAIVGALVAGAAPFIIWLPVFINQRQIGIPYSSATTVVEKLAFFGRTLAQFLPVRPAPLAALFAVLLIVTLLVLIQVRSLERDAVALGLLFLALLAVITAQNLLVSRYALPVYGLACVFLGSVIARACALVAAAKPAVWRRWWLLSPVALLALLAIVADVRNAYAATTLPKSGIRSIVHSPELDAKTLYVLAPDYLASTFAFYARDRRTMFAGFVRWSQPEVFALANYAADWARADAVDRTLAEIAIAGQGKKFLDIIADDRARDQGHVPYGKVRQLLSAVGRRYRLISRTAYPGRYESVSDYRYLLRGS